MISTVGGYGLMAALAAIAADYLQAQESTSSGLALDLCSFGLFPGEGNLYRV